MRPSLSTPATLARRIGYAALGDGLAVGARLRAIERADVSTILNLHRVGEPDERLRAAFAQIVRQTARLARAAFHAH